MDERSLVKRLPITLVDAGTVSINPALGHHFTLSTAVSRILGAPGTGYDEQVINIKWKNTSGSPILITLTTGSAGSFRFPGSSNTLPSTPAGATHRIVAIYNLADDRWDIEGLSASSPMTIGKVFVHSRANFLS